MMPLSTDVSLPNDISPVFPGRCVVCDSDTKESGKIAVNAQGVLLQFLLPLMALFGSRRIEFPLCSVCKRSFRRQRWLRTVSIYTTVVIAAFVSIPFLQGWNRTSTKLALIAIAGSALIPQLFFEMFFPRWFDATINKKTTDYEFKSEDYAMDFYLLNRNKYPSIKITVDSEEA